MSTLRICTWSGPRNVSTALMYSFAQRSDTQVLDEPLYGHYLRVSGADHPGRAETLAAMDCDGARVVREVILGSAERPVLFMKQMAHHLIEGLDRAFLAETANVLLIRDPADVLRSLDLLMEDVQFEDTGLGIQTQLLAQLEDLGQAPAVLDSKSLLLDPPGVLARLCSHLGLDFQESMLAWPPGPRPEDGVWAPHWYASVHRSTGFRPYSPKTGEFPGHLRSTLEQCRPHYRRLLARAIR